MLIKRSVGPLCFLSCIDVELMTLPSPLYLFWGCICFARRSFSCIDFVTLLCCLVNPLWIPVKALSVLGFVVMNHLTYQGKKNPLDQLNLINGAGYYTISQWSYCFNKYIKYIHTYAYIIQQTQVWHWQKSFAIGRWALMQIYKYIDIYSSRLKDLQKMTFFIIKKQTHQWGYTFNTQKENMLRRNSYLLLRLACIL